MRSLPISSLTCTAAGFVLVAGTALAASGTVDIAPNAARTYCNTDPLNLQVGPGTVDSQGNLVFTDDLNADDFDTPTYSPTGPNFTNETVWEVVGALGDQSQVGEAYCGALEIPATLLDSRGSVANMIQDCVGVLRFDIPDKPTWGPIKAAWLVVNGTNLATNNTLGVRICDYDGNGQIDTEGPDANGDGLADDPDCIIGGDDFAGGSFAGIHDVLLRKGDNVEVDGSAVNINFGDFIFTREIRLSDRVVDTLNEERRGGQASFIARCANEDGHTNGFLGGADSAIVIHDPAGLGFGLPGTTSMRLLFSSMPSSTDDPNSNN